MRSFSFTQDIWRRIHKDVKVVLPGIQKLISVYLNDKLNRIEALVTDKLDAEAHYLSIDSIEISEVLCNLRKTKVSFQWLNKSEIPFEYTDRQLPKLKDIFDEKQNTILLLRFKNSNDGNNDLLFIYLKENPGNFGIRNSKEIFSTETKSAIGFLIHNQIRIYLSNHNHNREVLIEQNSQTQLILSQFKELKHTYQKNNQKFGESLILLCRQYLSDISKKLNKKFVFTKEAEGKIASYDGEIMKLQKIIERSAAYAYSLYLDTDNNISIDEWFINLNEQKTANEERKGRKEGTTRVMKTINLLDRMENAAIKLKEENIKMNGSNLGKAFEKPISAPAISDALYHHKERIINLFEEYPDRWLSIRKDFRPIKRLSEK